MRRLRNWWGRLRGFGGCYRCGGTWDVAEKHYTPYMPGRACFPLCETCWQELTPSERLPYYDALVDSWLTFAETNAEVLEYEEARELIREVVAAGG